MRRLLSTIALLALTAMACSDLDSSSSDPNPSDVTPSSGPAAGSIPSLILTPTPLPPEVDIGTLISDYVKNSVAADQTYLGQSILLEFPVMNIGRDISENSYLLYSIHELAQFGILGIQASFHRRAESAVAQLQLGDMVALICKGGGLLIYIQLADCLVVEAKATAKPNLTSVLPGTSTPVPTTGATPPIPTAPAPRVPSLTPTATPIPLDATGTHIPTVALPPTILPTPTQTMAPVPSATPRPVIRVTKTADTIDGMCDADCSLREAIRATTDGDTIAIPAGTYTLVLGRLDIVDKNLTLAGGGDEDTFIQAAETLDNANSEVFRIVGPANVMISDVTIRHGRGSGVASWGGTLTLVDSIITRIQGRGISNIGGVLTLISSIVSENAGGGISSWETREFQGGSVTLRGSTVSDNVDATGGGLNISGGTAILIDSTISGNSADANPSGGGVAGGIYMAGGMLILNNSTVSGNTARHRGGGIFKFGFGTLTLTNSTVSGNTATLNDGGGIFSGTRATFVNSTVVENQAGGRGGGVYNDGTLVELVNTLIAQNSASNGPDCSGKLASLGHNLVGNSIGCNFGAAGGDQVSFQLGIDPRLGPLQDNGGPTDTHALLEGSPAIDAGDDGAAPETDQRGVHRPRGTSSDIGAFEF